VYECQLCISHTTCLYTDVHQLFGVRWQAGQDGKTNNMLELEPITDAMRSLIRNLDRVNSAGESHEVPQRSQTVKLLLPADVNFLLGPWLADAQRWAFNDSQLLANRMFNARNLITLWGPDGEVHEMRVKVLSSTY
jgi:hypothetical protein